MTPKPTAPTLEPGDKILHPYNRELGPGRVEDVSAQRLTVHFPRTGDTLQFAAANHPLVPLTMQPGADPDQWLEDYHEDMVERLARLDVDTLAAFRNRVGALELMRLREARGLGSFLGGRIELFPHQLHVAESATRRLPVRWLLADEVGLGKTVEACLILNHLVRTREAERVLIVAPRSLVVQWLGELWRKFHQVFVLVDHDRREDVRKEKGPGFNPFDVYDKSVVALEDLLEDTELARLAHAASPHLLVVDEAHRLRRRKGTAGSPEYRTVAPLCERSENVLLLSATPLEADAHGFFRLLQLLRPEEFPSWERFEEALAEGKPLPPCTSSTNRTDVGGLPPRVGCPVDLEPFPPREAKELETLSAPAVNAAQKAERLRAFARVLAEPHGKDDPRIQWLGKSARKWAKAGEKTLIFVSEREALTFLKKELEYHTSRRVAVFHEDLSPAQRDLEVARFAEEDGPPLLIATESGGEGRNFQFAKRLDPVRLAVGSGRRGATHRAPGPDQPQGFRSRSCTSGPAEGFGAEVSRDFTRNSGSSREPLGGLDRALGHVVDAIHDGARRCRAGIWTSMRSCTKTHEARQPGREAPSFTTCTPDRYRPEMAQRRSWTESTRKIWNRRTASESSWRRAGSSDSRWNRRPASLRLVSGVRRARSTVEALHGVPTPEAAILGTFDRAEAVEREPARLLRVRASTRRRRAG